MSFSLALAQMLQWLLPGVLFLGRQGRQNSQMAVCGYCGSELSPLDRWWFHCDECMQRTHWQCGGFCPGCRCCNGHICPYPLMGHDSRLSSGSQVTPRGERYICIEIWWGPKVDVAISGPWRQSGREYCLDCIRDHVCDDGEPLPDDGFAVL